MVTVAERTQYTIYTAYGNWQVRSYDDIHYVLAVATHGYWHLQFTTQLQFVTSSIHCESKRDLYTSAYNFGRY